MAECEDHEQKYLFRQRSTTGVKQLVQMLERQGGWQSLMDGWEGAEGQLQLTGWTRKRRMVVLRHRRPNATTSPETIPLLEDQGVQIVREPIYEDVVPVAR